MAKANSFKIEPVKIKVTCGTCEVSSDVRIDIYNLTKAINKKGSLRLYCIQCGSIIPITL